MSAWGARWGGRWGDRWGSVGGTLRRILGGAMGGGRKRDEEKYGPSVADYIAALERLKKAVAKRELAPVKVRIVEVEQAEPAWAPPADLGRFHTLLARVEGAIFDADWAALKRETDRVVADYEAMMDEEDDLTALLLTA